MGSPVERIWSSPLAPDGVVFRSRWHHVGAMNITTMEQPAESPLKFPTEFPIKVMGRTQDGFAQAIVMVVQKHAPDFDPATMEMRASSAGKYLSLTCTVHATSRDQLDNLYRELTSHPMVAMAL
jgi:hypothetical protein